MQNLKNIENNLDKKFTTLFDKLLSLKMYEEAKKLNDLYYSTKTNAYARATETALKVFNKQ